MPFDIAKDVQAIKSAILKSRYVAARLANAEMLKLYYAIGAYVSRNSRFLFWLLSVLKPGYVGKRKPLQKENYAVQGSAGTPLWTLRSERD